MNGQRNPPGFIAWWRGLTDAQRLKGTPESFARLGWKAKERQPLTTGDERRHVICLCPDCVKPRDEGWKEAAIAWAVCASIHEEYAKGKDALYTTRHADFVRHHEDARKKALA